METRNAELRAAARDEERRRRDEALTLSLQQQIDELRSALREQTTRQQRLEEVIRQLEGQLGQAQLTVEETRQAASRAGQLRQLDEQRLRQQVAELQERVDEPIRPLRTLQAQMAELIDQQRQRRDQEGLALRQVGEIRLQVEAVRSEVGRALEAARQVREGHEAIQQAQTTVTRDLQRISDQSRLIEQEIRRRVTEIEQQIGNLGERISEVASYRPTLEESIRRTREDMGVFQPQLDLLVQRDKQIEGQLARIQHQAEERDALMRERAEDIRNNLTTEIETVAEALEEASTTYHQRLTEWEGTQRELANRIGALSVRLTGLQQDDERQVLLMRRIEERLVRSQLEQAQRAWEELMGRRQKEQQVDDESED